MTATPPGDAPPPEPIELAPCSPPPPSASAAASGSPPRAFRRQRSGSACLPALFVLGTLPILLLLSVLVPPGEVPDEVAHLARADSVRHGMLWGHRGQRLDIQGQPVADVTVRAEPPLIVAGFAFFPGTPLAQRKLTLDHIDALLQIRWAGKLSEFSVPNTGVYPPTLYVAAALVLEGSKRAGIPVYISIILARIANSLAYVVLGWAAIRLAKNGRRYLFLALSLPMSLWLAASLNQDGLLIGLSALTTGLFLRRTRRSWWFGAVALSVVLMTKPYLLPFAGLPVLVRPASKGMAFGAAIRIALCTALPGVIWSGSMARFVAAPFVRGPAYAAGPAWPPGPQDVFATTDAGAQLWVLTHSPTLFLSLPWRSFLEDYGRLTSEFVGVLGTLDLLLPPELAQIWLWIISVSLVTAICGLRANYRHAVPKALSISFMVSASIWLLYIIQYLSWTRVGAIQIEGVQGRYLIPVFVLSLPFLSKEQDRTAPSRGDVFDGAFVCALSLLNLMIPLQVIYTYYVR